MYSAHACIPSTVCPSQVDVHTSPKVGRRFFLKQYPAVLLFRDRKVCVLSSRPEHCITACHHSSSAANCHVLSLQVFPFTRTLAVHADELQQQMLDFITGGFREQASQHLAVNHVVSPAHLHGTAGY